MQLSIVTTLYQSESHIEAFYQRTSMAAYQLVGDDYEIIFVNDCFPDSSLELAIDLTERDSHVTVIDLSRNFGHYKAIMTGLTHAQGDRIFLIDSDLEEEPEWLLDFARQMEREQADVIFGVQGQRKGNIFERWSGRWFYTIFRFITGLALPNNLVTTRLMQRRYVDALLQHKEREVFLAGLWHITGFYQRPQKVKKHSTSKTTYTLGRKFQVLVNSITSFSNAPLVSIFYIGLLISLSMGIYALYLVGLWLIFSTPVSGWTSIMVSIWLLGGLVISFIGIVGIYLSKIFSEVKQRPYTIIRQIYKGKN